MSHGVWALGNVDIESAPFRWLDVIPPPLVAFILGVLVFWTITVAVALVVILTASVRKGGSRS